jgi:Protein of unknown function (DUF1214)
MAEVSPSKIGSQLTRLAFQQRCRLESRGLCQPTSRRQSLPGLLGSLVGSQRIGAFVDSNGECFDGSKIYKMTLPPKVSAEKFWSLTLYDNQTRSMLDTPQRYPRAGSQSYPSPAAEPNADGSTTIYFARNSLTASSPATGFKPCPARVGARSCALQPAGAILHKGVATQRDRANGRSHRRMRAALRAAPT